MKKMIRIVSLLLALILLTACGGASTKSYTCRELTMEVPSSMRDVSGQSDFSTFTFALDSKKLAIFGLNETFAEYPVLEEYTTKDYADLVIELYSVNGTAAQRAGKNYHYIIGFWMIQIAAPTADYNQEAFFSYMDTVNIG